MKKTNDQLCDEILDAMEPDARAVLKISCVPLLKNPSSSGEMTCPCRNLDREKIEESIKRITYFAPEFPKLISPINKCCAELFKWEYELCRKRAEQLEELSLSPQSTGQDSMNL